MKLAAVIGLLDVNAKAALAAWCETELHSSSIDPVFKDPRLALRRRYDEQTDTSALWLVTALVAGTHTRFYECQTHTDTDGTSPAAHSARASMVRTIWEQLAVICGASQPGAQVVGVLAQTWEPVNDDVTQAMWTELLDTAEGLAR